MTFSTPTPDFENYRVQRRLLRLGFCQNGDIRRLFRQRGSLRAHVKVEIPATAPRQNRCSHAERQAFVHLVTNQMTRFAPI